MKNEKLIKNYIIYHAYFCHLIENGQADAIENLCDISLKLCEEIVKRNISSAQIEECIKKADLEPKDSIMIDKYIFKGFIDLGMGES